MRITCSIVSTNALACLPRDVRARTDGRALPIPMIGARNEMRDIMPAMRAGVNNYIVKPFTSRILKDKIDAVLNGAATAA